MGVDYCPPTADIEAKGVDTGRKAPWWLRYLPLYKGKYIGYCGGTGDKVPHGGKELPRSSEQEGGGGEARKAPFSIDYHGSGSSSEDSSPIFYQRKALTENDIHRDFSTSEARDGMFRRLRRCVRRFSFTLCLQSTVPLQEVLRNYKLSYLLPDLFTGVSEGVMAIPQGMSYALLARLPPQFGLYVNLIYPLVYMIFGTGRHVAVGVSAIEDLLLGESVTRVISERERLEDIALTKSLANDPKTSPEAHATLLETASTNETLLMESRIAVSIGMSVCVGMVFALMRILQAGLLADLLAVPVLSGFSTASAFLVGTSQLKHVLGLSIPAYVEDGEFKLLRQWWYCITHIYEANWVSIVICLSSICILAICKIFNKRYFKSIPIPGPLLVVIIFTALSAGLSLESSAGIKVVGVIPSGFPSPRAPQFTTSFAVITDGGEPMVMHRNVFLMMLREALALTAMFFVIHISIAKTITQQKKTYHIRPDQELVALSCCNFVGSCFQCFPNATSLSRTCVVSSAGGFTQLHQISNALVLVFTLSFMTPLLYALPTAVLGAVVLFGVYGMLDFREFIRLAKIGGLDVMLWLVCFLITIIFGAMEGILASILLSLLWLLRKTARPACCVLGRLPETFIYRNVKRFPMAVEEEGIRILRFDASLNFSNSDFFESRVLHGLLPSTQVVIMDGSSINDLDVTAIRMLERLVETLREKGMLLLFANWKGPMRDFLQKASFYDVLPPEHCFLSIPDAVFWARRRLRLGDTKEAAGANDGHSALEYSSPIRPDKGGGKGATDGRPHLLSAPPPARPLSPVGVRCTPAESGKGTRFPLRPLAVPFFGPSSPCLKRTQKSKSAQTFDVFGEPRTKRGALRRRSTGSQSLSSLHEEEDRIGGVPIHQRSMLWDGLSARSMEGLRIVTEITGSGQAVRWAVCTTTHQETGVQQGAGEPSTPRSTAHQLCSQQGSEDCQHFFM